MTERCIIRIGYTVRCAVIEMIGVVLITVMVTVILTEITLVVTTIIMIRSMQRSCENAMTRTKSNDK